MLILEIADDKNDFADMAAEKLLKEALDQLGSLSVHAEQSAPMTPGYLTAHVSSCDGLSKR